MTAKIQTIFLAKNTLTDMLRQGKNTGVKTIDGVKNHKAFCAFESLGLALREVGRVLWCLTSPGVFYAQMD